MAVSRVIHRANASSSPSLSNWQVAFASWIDLPLATRFRRVFALSPKAFAAAYADVYILSANPMSASCIRASHLATFSLLGRTMVDVDRSLLTF